MSRSPAHLAASLGELELGLVTLEQRLADLGRLAEALRVAARHATTEALR